MLAPPSVHTLYAEFEQAVGRYYQELMTRDDLQQNFDQMFEHYGYISMAIYNIPSPDNPHS